MAEITDYLNGLNEQQVQEEQLIQLVNNPIIEEICEFYELWYHQRFPNGKFKSVDWTKSHDVLLEMLKDLKVSSDDIRNFSIVLKKYEKQELFWWSGIFISALIEISPNKNFEILTKHFDSDMWYLGYKNKKNITITGNVGAFVADEMQAGILVVKGNAGQFTGFGMSGGEIHVSGKIEQIEQTCRGKIYQGGKLIYNGTKN